MHTESQKQIEKGLRELSLEKPEPSHMDQMLAGARRRMERNPTVKSTAKRMVWIGAAVAVTMIVLLVVPMSYDLRVGSLVTAEWSASGVDPAVIAAELGSIDGVMNYSANTAGDSVVSQMAFRKIGISEARERVRNALQTYLGDDADVNISGQDIVKRIGGNVLAAGTGGRITINAEGLSDVELEAAIVEALYAHGATHADVQVATTDDGYKTIDVEVGGVPDGSLGDGGEVTIEITN